MQTFVTFDLSLIWLRKIGESWPNQNYWVQKWKIAELLCGLFCHFLQKRYTNLAFLKEFYKSWQNNPQNNLAIFHFGIQ